MTGGILALALVLYERITGADVPLSVYWATAAFTVFASTFLAWRDEYLGREQAEKQLHDREKRRTIRTELAKLMSDGQALLKGLRHITAPRTSTSRPVGFSCRAIPASSP